MDPVTISAIIGAIGLGASIFGGLSGSKVNAQEAAVSANIASLEGKENDVRHQAMEVSGQRAQLQNLRTAQRMRAASVQAGAGQTGSLSGSGVQGGIAETVSEGGYGAQGIQQQLAFGNKMFAIDKQITSDKIQLAQLGGKAATDAGIASLGGALFQSSNDIGKLVGGFGKLFS